MTNQRNNLTEDNGMNDAKYFRCGKCGYEFLAKATNPLCPKCKSQTVEEKDVKDLLGFDD
jgi:predicted Zn-ribbon and HTH transcriptional regulator